MAIDEYPLKPFSEENQKITSATDRIAASTQAIVMTMRLSIVQRPNNPKYRLVCRSFGIASFFRRESDDDQLRFRARFAGFETFRSAFKIVVECNFQGIRFA